MASAIDRFSTFVTQTKATICEKMHTPTGYKAIKNLYGVGSILSAGVTSTLAYTTFKAAAFSGFQCASNPWEHHTILSILRLPTICNSLPEPNLSSCGAQIGLTLGLLSLTGVTAFLTYRLGKKYLSNVPNKPLPPIPTKPINYDDPPPPPSRIKRDDVGCIVS